MLVTVAAPPPVYAGPPIGINLSFLAGDEPEIVFADAMREMGPWHDLTNNPGPPELPANQVDANGWPLVDCQNYVFGANPDDIRGAYAVSFNGQATIFISLGNVTVTNQVYNSSTNTTTATLTINGQGVVRVQFLNTIRTFGGATNTGFTNLKIMRPISPGSTTSYSTSTQFTTQCQTLFTKFSVLKFEQFVNAIANPQVNWSDRTLPSYAIAGTPAGCPWENVIQLCNFSNKDMFLNLPFQANDTYLTKLAQMIKYGSDGVNPYTSVQANPVYPPLNANLNCYLELADELWNYAYPFNIDTAANVVDAQNEVAAGSPLNFDGDTNQYTWAQRRVAGQAVRISNIFRSVFGDSAMTGTSANPRIRVNLPSQEGNESGIMGTQVNYLWNYYNNAHFVTTPHPPSYYIYGGGGSAYYNPDCVSDTLTLNQIWTSQQFDINQWIPTCQAEADWAIASFGHRVSYEGGPGLDDLGHNSAVKAQAWADPRMTTLVTAHQTAWSQNGGGLLVYYVSSRSDLPYQWAFTDNIYNLSTPKLVAIDQINAGAAAVSTYGTPIPSTIQASTFKVPTGWANPASMDASSSGEDKNSTWIEYTVSNATADTYTISLSAGSVGAGNQADIYMDGVFVGTVNVPNTGSLTTFGNSSSVTTATMPIGTHGLVVKTRTGIFGFNSILVAGSGPPVVPAAPTGLTAVAHYQQVSLAWNASTGASTYNVYRGTSANGENGTPIVTGLITTAYNNTGLANGTTYFYKVAAVNTVGTSGMSNEVSAMPVDNTAHAMQTATAPTIDGTVDAVWSNAPTYSLGHVTTGGTSNTGNFQMLWDSSNLYVLATVNDSTLVKDTTSVWNGDTVEVYIDGDDNQSTTYDSNDFQYAFQFNNTTATEGKHSPGSLTGVTFAQGNFTGGYRIEAKIPWSTIGVTPSANMVIGTDVMSDDCVTSGSRAGKIAWWATVDNTWSNPSLMGTGLLVAAAVPPTPTGLTATPGNAQVALSWNASSGATAYDVKRSTVSGSGYVTVSSPATTNYTNTGLTNGTAYYFVVDAKNSFGTSGNSSQASATPTAGTSGLVKINTGGPAVSPFAADIDFSGGTAATNWTGTIDTSAVTSPAPQAVYQSERYGAMTYTMGGLTPNANYTVRLHFCENYWSANGQRTFTVAINSINVLTNFDIFAAAGAQHKANIQQFTAAANSSGQIVVTFTNVVDHALINGIEVNSIAPPAAPTGLAATPGNAQVALSWTASSGATSYNVLRSTVSGSGYASVATGIAVTNYTNTGLTNGTTYYFVVTATNAGGTSANSSQVSAVPTGAGTFTLVPTADRDNQSDNAAGTNPTINVSMWDNPYYKFSLSGVTGTVTSATLRIYRLDTLRGSWTFNAHQASDAWTENGTVPGLGATITSVTNNAIGYMNFDVTSYVTGEYNGDKVVSFGLDNASPNWISITARESTTNQPQLVVVTH